jgi:polyhydroxyalkanoate synthesis regulator phasin
MVNNMDTKIISINGEPVENIAEEVNTPAIVSVNDEPVENVTEDIKDTTEETPKDDDKIDLSNTSVDNTVGESERHYKEVFASYDLSKEDVKVLLEIVKRYKAGEKLNYYDAVPESFKAIADGLRNVAIKEGTPVSKNDATKFLLAELIRDAQTSKAFEDFDKELASTISEMDYKYNKIFTEAFDEVFAKIDELETKDPEQAAKIKIVKNAFDDAANLTSLTEFINSTSVSKLTKWATRFKDEVDYFNTKVNVTNVKIPDLGEVYLVIVANCPDLNPEDVKKFVVALCRQSYTLDVKNNIGDLAYIYRLVSSIYSYKFTNNSKETPQLLKNITEVIKGISSRSEN